MSRLGSILQWDYSSACHIYLECQYLMGTMTTDVSLYPRHQLHNWRCSRCLIRGFPGLSAVKKIHLPMQEMWVWSLGWKDPLEEEMATHSSIFFFNFFFICSEFCHTLKWNSHGFTCVPHPNPPSHLPLHPFPPGPPRAPGPSACLMHPTWAGDLFHPW